MFELLLVASLASAQTSPVAVALPDGRLVPGATNTVQVAVSAAIDPPEVSSSVGPVRLTREVSSGVWEYAVPVPVDAHQVEITATLVGRPWTFPFEAWLPTESTLELPRRIDGVARGGEVVFDVRGEDLPPPEALQVVVGEGRVLSVVPAEGGLRVTVQPDDSPFPRHIPVGVRDRRRDERPAWGGIRLRARPTLPIESEPGSEVTLYVGDREYGPFTVDASGRVEVKIDQYPEEIAATALFRDELGNEARTEIPLARQTAPQLVAFPSADLLPGSPPPLLYLGGVQANGFPWRGVSPTCRTATTDLQVRELSRGQWMVPLPATSADEAEDLRVDCDLGADASVRSRVPVARGIPARLGLRVWPTDLRADFPFAEIRVVLEDHLADRLPAAGIVLGAEQGTVSEVRTRGTQLEAEYDGTAAAESQSDAVFATWSAPAEGQVPDALELAWDTLPRVGEVEVAAKVLDALRRPVPGTEVELRLGEVRASATSDDAGVARTEIEVPTGATPLLLVARVPGREVQAAIVRGKAGRVLDPHDLSARADLSLRPGRVAGLSVQVDPQVLRAAPGAVAWVYVDVEDGSGNPIADEDVTLTATEGYVGALRSRPDGTLVAEYIPSASERPRDVEITAEVDTVRSTTRLSIAPRPVRLTLGAWGGVQTNFGSVVAPVFGLDGDLRVRSRLAGESLMLRLGVARYRFSDRVATGAGPDARLRSSVYPLTAAALFRRDAGRFGAWVGGGGIVAVQDLEVSFGSELVDRSVRVLGGPTAVGGVGIRVLGGEALVTVQGSVLTVDAGDAGFSGNIGGLATGVGYRLVF